MKAENTQLHIQSYKLHGLVLSAGFDEAEVHLPLSAGAICSLFHLPLSAGAFQHFSGACKPA
jgi:hypothetical protein